MRLSFLSLLSQPDRQQVREPASINDIMKEGVFRTAQRGKHSDKSEHNERDRNVV